jgi:HEAT repeat protein
MRICVLLSVLLLLVQGCTSEGVSGELSALVHKTRSDDPLDRVEACRDLGAMGWKAAPAVPALIPLLNDNRIAQTFLEKIWDSVSLGSSGCGVNYAASKALVQIGDSSIDPLIVALGDTRPRMRAWAAITLSDLAARGIKAVRAVPPLVKNLTDKDADVRTWSARALGAIGDTAAVAGLIPCLSDPDPQVRGSAAASLGNLGDTRAIPPLINMLRRNEPNSDFAVMALRQLAGQELGHDPEKWQQWWDSNSGATAGR